LTAKRAATIIIKPIVIISMIYCFNVLPLNNLPR